MNKKALVNAKVYVQRGCFEQAVLVEGGIIKAVGKNDEIIKLAGSDAEIIDCGGKTLIPGLNDTHLHLLMVGDSLVRVNITDVTSIEMMIERVKEFIKQHPERCKDGVHSVGWNQDLFTDGEKRIPTRHDLDKISTEIPIVLERVCGHVITANTKALEMRGIGKGTPQFKGGTFELEQDGYPNGVFTENACGEILSVFPEPSLEECETRFLAAMDYAVSCGLTSVQSNDAGTSGSFDSVFQMIHNVYDGGKAKLKYHHQVCCFDVDTLKSYIAGEYTKGDYSHPWLSLGPLKLFKDGSLGGRTATMRNGYVDDPGNLGVEAMSDELMCEMCKIASDANMQVVTHVIGDKAIEDTVACYETVLKNGNPLRHGLVHCQITDLFLIERIVKDELTIMYQPIFLDYDMHAVLPRCGEKLSSTSYAFGTAQRMGGHVSYGTDSPVEDLNPFPNIYSAVTRKDKTGYPDGGFFPNECVDVCSAIDAYTAGSAYNQFMENTKGRIKAGFEADMVLLDKDIFTCDPMEIRDIKPVMTMVGGIKVFER